MALTRRRFGLDSLFWYRAGYWLLRRWPPWVGRGVGRLMATLVWLAAPGLRSAVRANLRVVEGERFHPRDVRATITNYGRCLSDFFRLPTLTSAPALQDLFAAAPEFTVIDELRRRGRGVILFSIHLGNWEAGGHLLVRSGYPVNFLLAHDPGQDLDRVVGDYRTRSGIRLLPVSRAQSSLRRVLQALKRNELVGILGDRDTLGTGPTVDFFGRPVQLPYGPIGLARAAGAPILPVFIPRMNGRYRFIIEAPLDPPARKGREEEELGRRLLLLMEKYIREYPTQWYNFFPVFAGRGE